MSPRLILVGGFLGAGKTTLLVAAAARLEAMNLRVGVIVNDQGGELVDMRAVQAAGFAADEITGGCFCCRFSDFIASAERSVARDAPDVILAEPVGSCTDLSATILQPIKRLYRDRFRLAPLTILVDPARAEELSQSGADPLVGYLFRKQIAEADLVRLSKADLYPRVPALEGVQAQPLSARTGEGVAEWLEATMSDGAPAGARLLDIDYDRYAQAEAALGWLNWSGSVRLQKPLTPAAVLGPVMTSLDRRLTQAGIHIAHLKMFAASSNGSLKAGVCRNGERPSIDGMLDSPPATRYKITLNLRASGDPEILRALAAESLSELPGLVRTLHEQAFQPSAPVPEHRFEEIV